MATTAIIGKTHTFQVLFLDDLNQPIVVDNPLIDLFKYSTGVKIPLVSAAPMQLVIPPEAGRYTYMYALPLTLVDGDNLHAEMHGTDPASGLKVLAGEDVVATSPRQSYPGITARFIKG